MNFLVPTLLVLPTWLVLALEHAAPAAEVPPPGSRVVAVDVYPERIELGHRFDYAQLLLSGHLENGDVIDVTRSAVLTEESPLVEISDHGLVRPRQDGDGRLVFTVEGTEVVVPVSVHMESATFEPSFTRDVMPILSRAGCNAGSCHGSAKGRNGFKLSLRGYDPEFDHVALTDDLAGRRFNPVAPERSLFLLKLTAAVPHEGGQIFPDDSPQYELLREWVSHGAVLTLDSPRVIALEIFPKKPTIPMPGMSQQVAVLATYTDGSVRDVTAEAIVETSSTEITAIDDQGLVTAIRRGEAAILARYEGRYAATSLFVMGDRAGYEWRDVPVNNWVDGLVHEKLRRIQALPSELCSDAEFLRRVTLDLTGQAPTIKATETFLLDERDSRQKREELIERLIGGAEFVDYWTSKWSDLLQVNSKFLGHEGASRFREWIRAKVASNTPYDRFAAEILNAKGSTYENPAAAYYKVLRKADVVMENTTQLFLGTRFNCNKCHDHPFERWTQDQHWQLAAFFGRVGRKNAEGSKIMPGSAANALDGPLPAFEEIIFDMDEGEVSDPDTGAIVPPVFPFEHDGDVPALGTRRERVTRWITAPENPYFARSYVNRLWSYFLGVGIIDPVDDIRAGNPPTNPELLARLTREFVDSGFDVRALMRTICRSRTYQHSIETNVWNEDDDVNFSHALARRLPAEVMFDALHRATGSVTHLPGVRRGTRAGELVDSSVKAPDGFLDLFGRPPRESACECERVNSMSLGQALNLVNGPTLADAISDPDNDITQLVTFEQSPRKIIRELYLAFFCREPTEEEITDIVRTFVATDPENRAALSPADSTALDTALAEWEASVHTALWEPARPVRAESAGGAEFTILEDGSFKAHGANPERDTYTVIVETGLAKVTGIRLEVLSDPDLPAQGPGRGENGNIVLSELEVLAIPSEDPTAVRPVKLQNATADFSQQGFPVANAIDGKSDTGWALSGQLGKSHVAIFETAVDAGAEGGTILMLTLDQQYGQAHTIGRFRISVTGSERPVRHHGLPNDVATALATATAARTPAQEARLYAYFIQTHAEFADKIRLGAAQDLAWALANSPAFLFNR